MESRPRAAQLVGRHRRRGLGRRDGHHRVLRLASMSGDGYLLAIPWFSVHWMNILE